VAITCSTPKSAAIGSTRKRLVGGDDRGEAALVILDQAAGRRQHQGRICFQKNLSPAEQPRHVEGPVVAEVEAHVLERARLAAA
jgi:hypothetical protein